jgi:hypothetical protein
MSTTAIPNKADPATESANLRYSNEPSRVLKRHLRLGWWCLLLFLTMGLLLEGLHGFKVGAYLKVSNETRRLMWTLAHAHGTLLGLVNIGFAFTVSLVPEWTARMRGLASVCLRSATILMPAGFFFGGVFIYSGDPGFGILLVPVGGILLFVAVFLTARAAVHFRLDSHPLPKGYAGGKRK